MAKIKNTAFVVWFYKDLRYSFVVNINKMIMKKLIALIFLGTIFTAQSQDYVTPRFFSLPDNVMVTQLAKGTYDGETKEIKLYSQEQMLFKDGVVTIIKKAEVIGESNFASESTLSYDSNGRLATRNIISMEQKGTEPERYSVSYSYVTEGAITSVFETDNEGNKNKIEEREYDSDGTLYKTTWINQKGNRTRTITFNEDHNETHFYDEAIDMLAMNGMHSEVIYFYENQRMNRAVTFLNDRNLITTLFITEYELDLNGNLTKEKEMRKYRAANALERRVMNEPYSLVKEDELKTDEIVKEVTYSNYLVNEKWVIQVPEVIRGNIIEFQFRSLQTTDGTTYTITDQNEILKFLDETYQKVKAKKQ